MIKILPQFANKNFIMVLRDTSSFIYSLYNDISMISDWEVLSLIKIKSWNNISSNGKN